RFNRWLNNVMDGGWGQGWIGVYGRGPADHNLVEGNIVKGVGQLSPVYKPAIQVSGANNTVRRNVVVSSKSWGLEVSSFDGGTAVRTRIRSRSAKRTAATIPSFPTTGPCR